MREEVENKGNKTFMEMLKKNKIKITTCICIGKYVDTLFLFFFKGIVLI